MHQLNKTLPPQGCGPRLLTVHDLNYLYGRNAFSVWRHGRRTRALMGRTDHVVAISQYAAQDVRQHLGWTGPLDVIYRGPRKFDGALQPVPGFESRSQPFLFHLSRMSPSKNPLAILLMGVNCLAEPCRELSGTHGILKEMEAAINRGRGLGLFTWE